MRGIVLGAAAVAAAVVTPILAIGALVGGIAAIDTAAPGVDPTKIPALARKLLPGITELTSARCPELPAVWVIAHIQAESSWNPAAVSTDANGGAAGLYQLNQANWTAAGGRPWTSSPPPADADILQAARHVELALPWVCTNLRTAAEHVAATGKPTRPLDAMLVCHIAGCGRVTESPTGIPDVGEARCDTSCAARVHAYIATVHRYVTEYTAAAAGPVSLDGLAAPVAFTGASSSCSEPDPTTHGCLTPATRHALDQIYAAFGKPGPDSPIRSATCWDPHPQNPRSDHPKGRACDFFPARAGAFPTGTDLETGWRLASWLRSNADALNIKYLIWQGRYWDPTTGDQNGWGNPYTGGGIYDPTDATGGHYDHIHLSAAT